MKFEILSTVTQINARLEALIKSKQQGEAGSSKGNVTPPPVGNHNSMALVSNQQNSGNSTHKPPKLSFTRVFWTKFVNDLYTRFSNVNKDTVIGDFNQLKQVNSVIEYYNQFEELRAQMVEEFGKMDEGYFVKSFIGGLKPEIRSQVEQFEVVGLSKAIHIARKEEVAIANLFLHTKSQTMNIHNPAKANTSSYSKHVPQSVSLPPLPTKPSTYNPSTHPTTKGLLPSPSNSQGKPPLPVKLLTHDEHQLKREQGLYHWCDAKFTPGHQKGEAKLNSKNVTSINAIPHTLGRTSSSRKEEEYGSSKLIHTVELFNVWIKP
ncbi:hypothetical protein RJ640_007472 [Escallonia rubra]|uniref:Ty3 transposon capsid-like protein domain-containing protein n=1 Tax=Escallonia rubra TaxID=112253 RepID=A0AA88UKZ5_9ASTE|nr:hypothetical protein RJ640_007472 [Escallonia rubra]